MFTKVRNKGNGMRRSDPLLICQLTWRKVPSVCVKRSEIQASDICYTEKHVTEMRHSCVSEKRFLLWADLLSA